jgi:diketogulonate reductase-like aldo/keto reductase
MAATKGSQPWRLAMLLVTFIAFTPVDANFFSRLLKVGKKEDNNTAVAPPPSGATAAVGSEAQVGSIVTYEDGMLMGVLSNNNKIPLVGVGVGNAHHAYVGAIVADAIQDDKKIRLIDTAHASRNEHLVVDGMLAGFETLLDGRDADTEKKIQIHVVTKVWYTHLGYERSKIAVEESLAEFQPIIDNELIDFKIHILLHWPRCYEHIPWMECDKEEEELPDYVKNAGPNPSKDPDNAWKESWKLLEDMYLSDKYPIASIGISNFHLDDIEQMDSFSRIHPHILQVNIWSLLFDAQLVDHCHKHRIHVQVFNAIQGTVMKPEVAPRAYHHIQKIAYEMSDEIDTVVTPAQVILAWLIQHGVSVIPRTSRLARLEENSAISLANIPALSDMQVETVAHAVEAYLSGDDLAADIHVSVSFHAVNKDIMLYWQGQDGNEVRIAHVKQGEVFNETTYPNHIFRTYDASNKDIYLEHQIDANFGDHRSIRVEL